jgi:hypothetical protein
MLSSNKFQSFIKQDLKMNWRPGGSKVCAGAAQWDSNNALPPSCLVFLSAGSFKQCEFYPGRRKFAGPLLLFAPKA